MSRKRINTNNLSFCLKQTETMTHYKIVQIVLLVYVIYYN